MPFEPFICHTWLAFHLHVNQSSALQISLSGRELITAAADGASGDDEHLANITLSSVCMGEGST